MTLTINKNNINNTKQGKIRLNHRFKFSIPSTDIKITFYSYVFESIESVVNGSCSNSVPIKAGVPKSQCYHPRFLTCTSMIYVQLSVSIIEWQHGWYLLLWPRKRLLHQKKRKMFFVKKECYRGIIISPKLFISALVDVFKFLHW